MKTLFTIVFILQFYISSYGQVPEVLKFKPVRIESFGGAPSRVSPQLMTSIKYWIKPNVEIYAIDYQSEFVKVVHQNDTVFVHSDNFKNISQVNEQIIDILKSEKERDSYFKKIKQLEERYKDSVRIAENIEVLALKEKEEYIKEKEEHENAKKIYNKYKSLGSPLAFIEASVSYNSIDNPEANLSVLNISNNEIDAYEINIYCYDNYNRPVGHYLYKTNIFKGISQDYIEPNQESFGTWTLYGHENTTKVTFVLKSVHYKNKGAWYPKNRISIKSE